MTSSSPKATIAFVATSNRSNKNGSNASVEEEVRALRLSDEDLREEEKAASSPLTATFPPTSASRVANSSRFTHRFVPLRLRGSSHAPSAASASLLDEVGGVEGLRKVTTAFYEKAFQDETLDKFIHSHNDPHGNRFALWIHQKLGGAGNLWDADRLARERAQKMTPLANGHRMLVHDRSSAHVAAWHSTKRPPEDVGRHFKLDECRVWMRLHFWALRESGLLETSPSFVDYYVRYIAHFVRVYESTAPAFARESWRWSASQENIDGYLQQGRVMRDVLGLSLGEALQQLPAEEADDDVWPYNKRAPVRSGVIDA